jgi:Transglycosylase
VATVLAGARVRQRIGTRVGQAQRVVQFAVSQQPGIGGDRGAAKFQQQTTVEIEPESAFSASPLGSPIAAPFDPLQAAEFYPKPPQRAQKHDFIRGMRAQRGEWGPGVYGAEAAARHYFHKSADALNPDEAVRLAAALPDPLGWSPRQPGRRLLARGAAIRANLPGVPVGLPLPCGAGRA